MTNLLSQPELMVGETANSCPACGGNNLKSLGPIPEAFHFCAFKFSHPINCAELFECGDCSFCFKNPCLSSEVLDDLYQRQPATVWGSTVKGREDVLRIGDLLAEMDGQDIRILDVGCYSGGLLRALAIRFQNIKKLQLHAVEPSAEAAAEASSHGIHVIGASIAHLVPSSRYDVIILTDVFEHILRSKDFLGTLRGFLAPRGYLVVMTGAYDSKPFSRHRNTYHYCAMPEHLAFLSYRHATWLAEQLKIDLVQYALLSHVNPGPSWKINLAKSLFHWVGRWIPVRWLSRDNAIVHEIARRRGMGIQNLAGKPDHAFAVFCRPAKVT